MDEYLAKLGLDVGEFLAAANALLTSLGRIEAAGIDLTKSQAALNTAVDKAARTLQGEVGSANALTAAVTKAAAASKDMEASQQRLANSKVAAALAAEGSAFNQLTRDVREAEAAYREFRQGQVTGEGGGTDISQYSRSDLQTLLATRNAQNPSLLNTAASMEAEASGTGYANAATNSDAQIEAETRLRQAESQKIKATFLDQTTYELSQNAAALSATEAMLGRKVDLYDEADQKILASEAERIAKASAAEAAGSGSDPAELSLPRIRYGLYDVSNATALVSAGITALGVGVVATAADYQQLFSQVERTSDVLVSSAYTPNQRASVFAQLKSDLIDLTTELPVSFETITQIATLGNQLGIASTDIEAFTKTVAEFSAVTNVGPEAAATAFGRLSQLLGDANFEKIGDEVAYLGVRSIATESDIISLASQLAVTTTAAGYTTEQTLALSTAVASLGVKPEAARGTFIRLFGTITAGVNAGGQKLADLAKISGLSSDEFRQQWGTDAAGTFDKFIEGLGKNSGNIKATLASLGITAVRDNQTLGLLVQNSELLTQATSDSKNSKGFLDKEYNVTASTLTSQLDELKNSVLALGNAYGQATTGPLSFFAGAVKNLIDLQAKLVANPVTNWLSGLSVIIFIVVGVLGLMVAGVLRLVATGLALRGVVNDLSNGTGRFGTILENLNIVLLQNANAARQAAIANGELAVSQGAAADAANLNTTAQIGNDAEKGVSGIGKLSSAIGKAGLVGSLIALGLQLPAIADGIKSWIQGLEGATPSVDALSAAVENLSNKQADQASKTVANSENAFGSTKPQANYFDINSLLNGGPLFTNTPFTNPAAANALKFANPGKTAITGGQAAVNYVTTGQYAQKNQYVGTGVDTDLAVQQLQNTDATLAKLYQGGNLKGYNALLEKYTANMKAAGVGEKESQAALLETNRALGVKAGSTLAATYAANQQATADQDSASSNEALTQTIFGQSIAAQATAASLNKLGLEIRQNGASTALSGQTIVDTLNAIYTETGDASTAAGEVLALANALQATGASAKELDLVRQYAYGLDPQAKATSISLDSLTKGLAGVDTSAQAASTSLRTVTDYASDLGSVLTRAFDLRFGDQQGLDQVTSKFQSLRDSVKEASNNLKQAKADLASLKDDRGALEQQLQVAEQFGDSAQIRALRAQLAANSSSQQQKKDEVAKDKDLASGTLTGNSAGAIANRSSLTGIIQQGETYLTTLAGNGASRAQLEAANAKLKSQFIDQATALGFNRKQVVAMAKGYDDFLDVIKKTPRKVDIDVNAKLSPAQQALKEFLDKANKSKATVDVSAALDDSSIKALLAKLNAEVLNANQKVQGPPLKNGQSGTKLYSPGLPFSTTGYADGGYTGDYHVGQVVGAVHGREFVLNARAQAMFPRQMLDAANHGVAPTLQKVTAKAVLPSGMTVSLGATERALLAMGGSQDIHVSADRFGDAMDDSFRRRNRTGSN